jgi:hypothetical protein
MGFAVLLLLVLMPLLHHRRLLLPPAGLRPVLFLSLLERPG